MGCIFKVVVIQCGVTANLPESDRVELMAKCEELRKTLVGAGIKVKGDFRDNYSPGWKFNHWELKVYTVTGATDIIYSVISRTLFSIKSCSSLAGFEEFFAEIQKTKIDGFSLKYSGLNFLVEGGGGEYFQAFVF